MWNCCDPVRERERERERESDLPLSWTWTGPTNRKKGRNEARKMKEGGKGIK